MSKERRSTIRVPVVDQKIILNGSQFTVDNMSRAGLFVLDDALTLKINDPVSIQFALPGDLGNLIVAGKVTHSVWSASKASPKLGFGIKFVNLTQQTKNILESYESYVRNKQIINISKRIIEEFFGSSKDPLGL